MRRARCLLLMPDCCCRQARWSAQDAARSTERYCTQLPQLRRLGWRSRSRRARCDAQSRQRCGLMGEGGAQAACRHDAAAGQSCDLHRRRSMRWSRKLETTLDAAGGARHRQPPRCTGSIAMNTRTPSATSSACRVDVNAMLPPGRCQQGFDNVAAGLGLSPALIQGYTTAAMKLSRAAVGDLAAT